jgi:hypothetical protein
MAGVISRPDTIRALPVTCFNEAVIGIASSMTHDKSGRLPLARVMTYPLTPGPS